MADSAPPTRGESPPLYRRQPLRIACVQLDTKVSYFNSASSDQLMVAWYGQRERREGRSYDFEVSHITHELNARPPLPDCRV